MKFAEIQEACWSGYRQAGMKKKGDRQVPNCVPVEEVRVGPEMSMNELLYTAAAKAMRDASREGIDLDYEDAIQQASKIYGIPYTPSQLPKLQAQLKALDARIAPLKQQLDLKKQQRKQQKYGVAPAVAQPQGSVTPATGRIKPATKTLEEEYGDPFIDNAARELLAMVLMFGVPFAVGVYMDIRNKIRKYQGREIIDALERKGVTMNRQTYAKVKPVLDRFDQAIRDDDGAEAKALAKQIEQMIVMGKLSAPEPQAPDTALAAKEKELSEDLKKWFKEKWVRFGPDGRIRGACARGSKSEGKPKCLPQSKAHALGKKGRASAAAKKRREDPNPERRGPARNVATKVREQSLPLPDYSKYPTETLAKMLKQSDCTPAKAMATIRIKNELDRRQQGVAEMDKSQKSQERHGDYPLGAKGTTAKPVPAKKVVKDLARDLDKAFAKEKKVREQHDWDDADEFGMPGSEFFPEKQPQGHYKVYYMTATDHKLMGRYATQDEAEQRVRELKAEYPDNKFIVFASQRGMTEAQTDYQKRRQRERDVDAGRPVKPLPKNPKTDYQKRREQQRRDQDLGEESINETDWPTVSIPSKSVLQGYTVEYDAGARKVQISRGGNMVDQFVFKGTPNLRSFRNTIDRRIGQLVDAQHGIDESQLDEKQDACYRKVKSRYKVWPSAYASGALVQCRKKGAANWGTKKK